MHRNLEFPQLKPTQPINQLAQALFARLIAGRGTLPSTEELLATITQQTSAVATDIPDPLNWWVLTLALREAGGKTWLNWSERYQRSIIINMEQQNGHSFLPGNRTQHCADDNIIATAAAILNLQAAYRYLPLGW